MAQLVKMSATKADDLRLSQDSFCGKRVSCPVDWHLTSTFGSKQTN